MTLPQQHHDTMTASTCSITPSRFPKDWLLSLVKKYSSQNTRNTPHDLRDSKILAVAPMVDQSDLPFRLLCRRYGSNVAFTPMIHCKLFCTRQVYREKFFNLTQGTPPQDRPLIAQLCGSDADYVLQTALLLQPHVDGIDLNCGCPQGIAKRGNYGAFLLEQPQNLIPLVKTLSTTLDIPVSVKVRILPTGVDESLALYTELVKAGVSMITIHGRTRLQKGPLTGRADWTVVKRACQLFPNIVILCNGSMSSLHEIRQCLNITNCDGVMCSEALLEYPPIYTECTNEHNQRIGPGRLQLAKEYLELARRHPPHHGGQGSAVKCLKAHLHRFLHADLQKHTSIRDLVGPAKSLEDLQVVVDQVQEIHQREGHDVRDEKLSWYVRHGDKNEEKNQTPKPIVKSQEPTEEEVECMACFFEPDDAVGGDY